MERPKTAVRRMDLEQRRRLAVPRPVAEGRIKAPIMEPWVLFVTIYLHAPAFRLNSDKYSAVAMHTQEFDSRVRCEWAAQRIQDTHNVGLVITGCFPKR